MCSLRFTGIVRQQMLSCWGCHPRSRLGRGTTILLILMTVLGSRGLPAANGQQVIIRERVRVGGVCAVPPTIGYSAPLSPYYPVSTPGVSSLPGAPVFYGNPDMVYSHPGVLLSGSPLRPEPPPWRIQITVQLPWQQSAGGFGQGWPPTVPYGNWQAGPQLAPQAMPQFSNYGSTMPGGVSASQTFSAGTATPQPYGSFR